MGISFLGVVYHYAVAQLVATPPQQNTWEWLVNDPVWNQIRLHERLFGVWLDGGTAPVLWTPGHVWVWEPPPDAKPWKAVNLRDFCQPQTVLLRDWRATKHGATLRLFIFYLVMLIAGLLLLLIAVVKTVQDLQVPRARAQPI